MALTTDGATIEYNSLLGKAFPAAKATVVRTPDGKKITAIEPLGIYAVRTYEKNPVAMARGNRARQELLENNCVMPSAGETRVGTEKILGKWDAIIVRGDGKELGNGIRARSTRWRVASLRCYDVQVLVEQAMPDGSWVENTFRKVTSIDPTSETADAVIKGFAAFSEVAPSELFRSHQTFVGRPMPTAGDVESRLQEMDRRYREGKSSGDGHDRR